VKRLTEGDEKMWLRNNLKMSQEELDELRSYKVVKSNDLIQKSRFQLSSQEQKIILYLISRIKPDDEDFVQQNFNIIEFCKICGMDYNNGKNYKNIKDTIRALADKSMWLMLEKGEEILVRWIQKATINKRSGIIRMRLDEDMKPYLLQLQERFTQYELIYTVAMRSQYSIRLYEILKSYEFRRWCKFDVDELKKMLFADNYKLFTDFKRHALDISLREINDLTDIAITYEIIKVGRKYGQIEFIIRTKDDMDERINAWNNRRKAIGLKNRPSARNS